ncbi:MAG: hypothetical protein Faunusvirus24_3 [Faunusvirus sp.]|uniref:Uncharacterized protein n=1 Tax=Faunusvirus sp. TaxID=2487766 RepID=A0A3G4ZXE0_9VIRU|nr:MAG: hypothetical protein Faunusvirus24_3 [Faunusvirus sp.]
MTSLTQCMAVDKTSADGKRIQCGLSRKNGDYCLRHSKASRIVRIDTELKYEHVSTKSETSVFTINILDIKKEVPKSISVGINKLANDADNKLNILLSGPIYANICTASDPIDVISQEKLWNKIDDARVDCCEFDRIYIFSYEQDGQTRCFNIKSIHGLIKNNIYNCPITGKAFTQDTISRAKQKIQLLKRIGYNLEEIVSKEDELKGRIIQVLSKMDKANMFIKTEYFLDLSIQLLKKLYTEIRAIWRTYKQDFKADYKNITDDESVFAMSDEQLLKISDINEIQSIVINDIDKFTNCTNEKYIVVSMQIVISGFSYVCKKVAESYNVIMDG